MSQKNEGFNLKNKSRTSLFKEEAGWLLFYMCSYFCVCTQVCTTTATYGSFDYNQNSCCSIRVPVTPGPSTIISRGWMWYWFLASFVEIFSSLFDWIVDRLPSTLWKNLPTLPNLENNFGWRILIPSFDVFVPRPDNLRLRTWQLRLVSANRDKLKVPAYPGSRRGLVYGEPWRKTYFA